MKMSLTHCAMACGWHQPKGKEAVVSRQRTGGRGCCRNPRTTSALRLHSCRALSSEDVRQQYPKKSEHTTNVKSVTYVPGRKCYPCIGTFTVFVLPGGWHPRLLTFIPSGDERRRRLLCALADGVERVEKRGAGIRIHGNAPPRHEPRSPPGRARPGEAPSH